MLAEGTETPTHRKVAWAAVEVDGCVPDAIRTNWKD